MGISWTYYQTKEFHDGGQFGRTTKLKSFMKGDQLGRATKLKSFMKGVCLDVLPN